MARIPAQLVKQLRDLTGARMGDCQQALTENQGNLEAAIAWLRQNDLIRAPALQKNEASQGIVESYIHHNKSIGALIEVNCQTELTFKLPVDRLPIESTTIAIAQMSDSGIRKMISKH